jgi:hypothetical protein
MGLQPWAQSRVSCCGQSKALLDFGHDHHHREAMNVDLALKLNVLAVCAAVVFVGAILLGAF